MHIIRLVPELNQGGIERGVIELNRFLVEAGHHATVLSSGGDQACKIEKQGGTFVPFDCKTKNPLTFPFRLYSLLKYLRKNKPDLIHCSSRIPAWFGLFASRLLNIPLITGIHGFHTKKFYNKALLWSDHIISVSNPLKAELIQKYHINESKISVIHRGVDLSYFSRSEVDWKWVEEKKKELGLYKQTVLLNIGRITPWKDQETFIKAIALLKKQGKQVVGLCIGKAQKKKYLDKLKQLAFREGVKTQIHFFDAQDHVRDAYLLGDVVISCSIRPEGFGRTITEALAMGLPVFATRHGGALDILTHEHYGRFFEPGNVHELAQLCTTIPQPNTEALRHYIETHFSLTKMARETLALYQRVCEGKESRRSNSFFKGQKAKI